MQFISNIRFWLFISDKTEWQSNCRKRNCPSNATRHVGYRWNLSFEPKSFIDFIMLRVFIDSKNQSPSPSIFASIVPHFSEKVLLVVFQSVMRRLEAMFTTTEKNLDYEWSPFVLRNSRASETRARVKIIPREKGETRWEERKIFVSPFLAWGDFHARSRFPRSTIWIYLFATRLQ